MSKSITELKDLALATATSFQTNGHNSVIEMWANGGTFTSDDLRDLVAAVDRGTTLVEAKAKLAVGVQNDGILCPCCGQFDKIYRRKLNTGMAQALYEFYTVAEKDPVHIRNIQVRGGDYAKLQYWGLLADCQFGMWQVTDAGEAFLRGIVAVQQYADVYHGQLLQFSGAYTMFATAAGSKFDKTELMALSAPMA